MDINSMTLEIEQHIDVNRPMADVFEGALNAIAENFKYPDGRSMQLHLERHPGGRWFRDLGNGTGHLWGFVQVIKPPTLLELYGPMFMSYPAANHLEIKLSEAPGGTRLTLRHRAMGFIEDMHREGVSKGWSSILDGLKHDLEN